MKRLHLHVSVPEVEPAIAFYTTLVRRCAQRGEGRLRQMDARGSAREPRHLVAGARGGRGSCRRAGRERRRAGGARDTAQGGGGDDPRPGGDDLLLRQIRQELGHRPGGRSLGNLLHARRRHLPYGEDTVPDAAGVAPAQKQACC